MQTTTVKIKGMNCGHCVKAVEGALRSLAEVTDLKVTIGEAVIMTQGPADAGRIRAAIEDAGYDVEG